MRSDRELQHDVAAELEWEPSLDSSRIGVSAYDGVVTLSGEVTSYTQRWTAERVARRVQGVDAIVDELTVRLPESAEWTDSRSSPER